MPETKGGIPKSIKIGDQEFLLSEHPELMQLVQAGRTDEKAKLYTTITGLEASIKVLNDEKKTSGDLSVADKLALKTAQDNLAIAVADLAKVKVDEKTTEPKDPKDAGKTGLSADDVQKIVADALAKQAGVNETELNKIKGTLTQKDVDDYRKEVLEKNNGFIIAGLIPEGLKSKEEINLAVERALKTSKDYIRQDYKTADGKSENLTLAEIEVRELAKEALPPNPPAGIYVPASGVPPPPNGNGDLTGKELVKNLSNMSQNDFNKNHEALRQEISKVGYGEQS